MNRKLLTLLIAAMAFIAPVVRSQSLTSSSISAVNLDTIREFCYFDRMMEGLNQDPAHIEMRKNVDRMVREYMRNNPADERGGQDYVIPVVFHVIHPAGQNVGTGENILYDQIVWQVNALNAAYSRSYPDYNGQVHDGTASNTHIKFCLANTPEGTVWTNNAEPGVMRYNAPSNAELNPGLPDIDNNNFANVMPLVNLTHPTPAYFPFDRYLNIWSVRSIGQGAALGVATPPQQAGTYYPLDGVIICYNIIGDNTIPGNHFPMSVQYDQGKILAHEIGHYLDLLHTFHPNYQSNLPLICEGYGVAGAGVDACDEEGDHICDIPPCQALPYWDQQNCAFTSNGCPNNVNNYPAHNYMSYMDDGCLNAFTLGQKNWMRAMLADNQQNRFNLWQDANQDSTGIDCGDCFFTANIGFLPGSPCPGTLVDFFTPTGTQFCANQWNWQFPGSLQGQSNQQNPQDIIYPLPGVYNVTLTALDGLNFLQEQVQVTVLPRTAEITGPDNVDTVCMGSLQAIEFQFTNGTPPYTYTLSDGTVFQTNYPRYNYVIPVNASQNLTIVSATDAVCDAAVSGHINFIAINCCPSILNDGDFSLDNNSFTTDLPESADCIAHEFQYVVGVYAEPPYCGWAEPELQSFGSGLSLNGPYPAVHTLPYEYNNLWCQQVTLGQGIDYRMEYLITNAAGTEYFVDTLVHFRVVLLDNQNNIVFTTNDFIPDPSLNNDGGREYWCEHRVRINTDNIPTGTYTLCIRQVENFLNGYFDFIIDQISLRVESADLAADAGSDITTCGNGTTLALGTVPYFTGNGTGGHPPYSYSWMPTLSGQPNNSYINFVNSLTDTTVYTLTVTDVTGCIVTDQVTAFPDTTCCQNQVIPIIGVPMNTINYYNISSNQLSTATFNSNVSNLQPYVFNGVLTISNNFTFKNCRALYFGENAKIFVKAGKTLTISGSQLSSGCGTMWEGIELEDKTASVVINLSNIPANIPTISYAKNGILSHKGGRFTVSNCTFFNNWIGINIDGQYYNDLIFFGNTLNGDYTNSSVVRSQFICLPAGLLQSSPVNYSGQLTLSGIYINDAVNVSVGSASSADANTFSRINNAVTSLQSSTKVYFNKYNLINNHQAGAFANLTTYPANGTAIYARNTCVFPCTSNLFTNHPTNLTVSAFVNNNVTPHYTNCTRGIFSQHVDLTVTNQFMSFNPAQASTIGAQVERSANRRINFTDNRMVQADNGILFNSVSARDIQAVRNHIDAKLPSGIFQFNRGIRLQEDPLLQTTNSNIDDNTVNNGMFGIVVMNSNNGHCMVQNNHVKVYDPNTTLSSSAFPINLEHGIALNNCSKVTVRYNFVWEDIYEFITSYTTVDPQNWLGNTRAFGLIVSHDNRLECNQSILTGYGYQFWANNAPTLGNANILGNRMTYHKYGMALTQLLGISGEVGNIGIGAGTGNDYSNANLFQVSNINSNPYNALRPHTLSTGSNQSNSSIFFRTPPENPGAGDVTGGGNAFGGIHINGQGSFACQNPYPVFESMSVEAALSGRPLAPVAEEKNIELGAYENEVSTWMNQKALFRNLAGGSPELATDPQLQLFYKEKQTESVGMAEMFAIAVSALGDSTVQSDVAVYELKIQQAAALNSSIPANTAYEVNLKRINDIYLRTFANGKNVFEGDDWEFINELSGQCVYKAGDAVFIARTMYNFVDPEKEFFDPIICSTYNGLQTQGIKPLTHSADFHIVPNPANDFFSLAYKMDESVTAQLSIISLTGEVLHTAKLTGGASIQRVDISAYPAGVYQVCVRSKNEMVYCDKLVIVK